MKSHYYLLLFTILFISCHLKSNHPNTIILGENVYQEPVWEVLYKQDKVKMADLEVAFEAYVSAHDIGKNLEKHYRKKINRMKLQQSPDGYYLSEKAQYSNLLSFRNPTPNDKEDVTVQNKLSGLSFMTSQVPNANNKGQWENIGPFGNPDVQWSATGNGAIQHIEMHPTNPAIMYASTRNGGLWKTTNYGKNWIPETDYFATNNTSCVEVCPANPNIMYLGAREDEIIWYSQDGGNQWENRSVGISGKIYDVHSDPTNASRAVVASLNGIFVTTDAGLTWTQKLSGRFTDIKLTDNWDLIIASDDSSNIDPKFYFSKDKGDSFIEQPIPSSFTIVDRFYMAIHKPISGPTQVYAYGIKLQNTPTNYAGLFTSNYNPTPVDGISYFNFTEVKHPTYNYPNGTVPLVYSENASGYEEAIDEYGGLNLYESASWIGHFYVSPNNPDWLLTFREKIWGTEDGGIIWSRKPSYGSVGWADNRYATTNTAKDSIYWCNDGGIWAIKETDLFPTDAQVLASGLSKKNYMNSKVVPKNGDICVSEGSQMDVSLTSKETFMTGGQDVGQVFVRNGKDSHVASADVYRGRIKPTDDSKFITGGLIVTLDGGTDNHLVYNSIEPDYFNKDRLYGFTRADEPLLVRSPNNVDAWELENFKGELVPNSGGHTWTPVHNNWETVNISSTAITELKPGTFEQSKANPEIAFLGDEVGGKLFVTHNLSSANPTWVQLTNAPSATRYRIATHQFNENIITIATNAGVFISKDKGQSWRLKGNFPENKPDYILMDKNTTEGIYIATQLTVYYIDEFLEDWVEFNKGLPLQSIVDMRIAYYPNNDNRLYIAKYGRGVWVSPLQSVLRDNAEKPVADFSLHGLTPESNIIIGESIKLNNLSLNAETLQWVLENGNDIINIGNEEAPELTLNTPGYYKVTLTATNPNGTATKTKEKYIKVNSITPNNCELVNDGDFDWFKRLKYVNIDDDSYLVKSEANYIKTDKTFVLSQDQSLNLYIEDNYSPDWNNQIKVWIDYNNDGDFDDANELIANSNGRVENFTTAFTVPNTASINTFLNMRVAALQSNTAPTSCQTTGDRQNLDFTVIIKPNVQFTALQHSNITTNSARLQVNYTNASNTIEGGFVYSTINSNDLNIENANVVKETNALGNSGSMALDISNLQYNTSYYYRPFLRDANGISYGNSNNFQLQNAKIPLLEALTALNNEADQWELKGLVLPENNMIEALYLEYGEDNFNNSVTFNPSNYPTSQNYSIATTISALSGITYKYRVKAVYNGKTFYSSYRTFTPDQIICTPDVANSYWYKRISNVTFNGNSNNSSGNTGYEDFSSIVHDVKKGETHQILITDSFDGNYYATYAVYIDYNNDGSFNGFNEIAAQGAPGGDIFTGNIQIPTDNIIYNEPLKMRVVASYGGTFSSCGLFDGEIEDYSIQIQSESLHVNDEVALQNISTFPNPVSNELNISFKNKNNSEYTFEVYSINGKLIQADKNTNAFGSVKKLDVSNLSSGFYLLKVINENQSSVIKFVKK